MPCNLTPPCPKWKKTTHQTKNWPRWWFQPIWKHIRQNEFIFPKLEVKNSKNIFESNHPPKTGPLTHHPSHLIRWITWISRVAMSKAIGMLILSSLQGLCWNSPPPRRPRWVPRPSGLTVLKLHHTRLRLDGKPRWNMEDVVNRNWLMDNNNTICKSYIYVNVNIYKYIIIPTTNLVNKTDHKTVGKSDANGYQLSSTFWTSQPIFSMNMLQHHEVYPSTPPIFRLSTPLKYFLRFLGTTNWHKTHIPAGVESLGRLRNRCIYKYILIHANK